MDGTASTFLLFIFIVIIILIIAIFIGRNRIFTEGKNLGSLPKDELTNLGYGTYIETSRTACITSDGKCLSAGIQSIVETCQPNSTTGNGCINELGEQTYLSRTTKVTCQPNCRRYILNEDTEFNFGQVCNYDAPFDRPAFSCLPSNARSYIYKKFNCIANDSTGGNRCTYKCGGGGIDSSGSYGDADPTKPSYIPLCATNPNETVTLMNLNYNNLNNIPSGGVRIKGYTITNTRNTDGTVNPENFYITPPYNTWTLGPSGTNNITKSELIELDTTFTTYNNCNVGQNFAKPYCNGTYYYFQPIRSLITNDFDFNNTDNPAPALCQLDNGFTPTKDCFYNPWYAPIGLHNDSYVTGNPDTTTGGVTGLKYINPYVGNTGYANDSINKYSWVGVGNYGYIYNGISCLSNNRNLTTQNPDGTYPIPFGSTGGASCLNLNATINLNNPYTSKLCSTSLTDIFQEPLPISFNLSDVINKFENNPTNFSFDPIQSYPQVSNNNTSNFICTTILPDGTKEVDSAGNPVPGCIKTCRYNPDASDINYKVPDMNGRYLPEPYWDLIGKNINLNYIDITGKDYFLTLNNTPCGVSGSTSTRPFLFNCRGTPPYLTVPIIYVYNGGGAITAGDYWSKANCDSESIVLTSNLRLTFSPYKMLENSLDGSYNLQCDVYGSFSTFTGYLSPGVGNTINLINVGDLNNYFEGENIIANNSGTSSLTFNPLVAGQQIPRSANNSEPFFILNYNPTTEVFSLYPSTFANEIYTIFYNGINGTSRSIVSFVSSSNKTIGQGYYTSIGFSEPIVKTSGLYQGENVTTSTNLQRVLPCYNKAGCEGNLQTENEVCYPRTCNLFYEYNPDYC